MPDRKQRDRIESLIDQYLEIVDSDRNQNNVDLYKNVENWNRDMWRGVRSKDCPIIPRIIAPDNSFWSRLFKKSLVEYYDNPYDYLEMQLQMKIYHFNNFLDNTPFTRELFLWFGVITELSFFGSEIVFLPHKEAWIKEPIINNDQDFDKLRPINFFSSGLMPRIHQFYEVMNEIADGRLKVMFPDFVRGPFCIAAHLRGLERILLDMMLEPESVHRLLRFIVEQHKSWTIERNKYLHEDRRKCKLYNDEIDCPTLSPGLYEEMIFPYEMELAEFHGGVLYWHSCGNITKFLDMIIRLPKLEMLHIGPYSSYSEAIRVTRGKVMLDICLNPSIDILNADAKQMKEKLEDIITCCQGSPISIRADALMPLGDDSIESLLFKMKEWCEISRQYLETIP
jgi:uroporphyrinogen-III decarboxylase